jgi:hypothetical protein
MGDEDANPRTEGDSITASPVLTKKTAERLGAALEDIPELAPTGARFSVNKPFWGGWDIGLHGGKIQPWLMIELSRGLYIGEQEANSAIVPPDTGRISLLRERIWGAIEAIVENEL